MKAKIWVDSKQKYEPYELPDGATMYETDMDKVVSCACCGKKSFVWKHIYFTQNTWRIWICICSLW